MGRLVKFLPEAQRMMIIGTAIIVFVFRAMPSPGPGLTWFEIDILLFNEQFFSVLSLPRLFLRSQESSCCAHSWQKLQLHELWLSLSIVGGILFIPSIGMYYGVHEWTSAMTGGMVDAKFIALVNTAIESPLGQVSMIPLLAWIAKNAPDNMKATFFAVFASFTNLALSASSLGTKYLNKMFVVTREVKDKITNQIVTMADYSELGMLLITTAIITFALPIGAVFIVQNSRFQTDKLDREF